MKTELIKMIESNIIFPIKNTSWISNIVHVRKKNGKIRLCVYLRYFNQTSLKNHHLLPPMERNLQFVLGSDRFSLLHGFSG